MSHPLVSIALCTYNGEKYVREQLESLLHQSYSNLEIIISDDASSDDTRRIIEDYRSNRQVKIFFQPNNLRITNNFEFAMLQATGEYVTFADQDDIWLPEKIEELYFAIGDKNLVYCDSKLMDEQSNKLNKKISDLRNMYSGNETTGFVFSNVVWGHAMMISKNLLPYVLPVPKDIPYDIWIAFKAATLGGIKYLNKPLTLYRQHATSDTKTIAVKAKPRSGQKLFIDFEKQLNWIKVMRDHERPEREIFYNQLYSLYKRKEKGNYVWPLFFFLLRHRRKFFMFTKKRWTSQVVEIFKQAKGVSR